MNSASSATAASDVVLQIVVGDLGAGLGEPGLDVAQLRCVDVGEHDAHPFGDEPFGEREADPEAPPVITATLPGAITDMGQI